MEEIPWTERLHTTEDMFEVSTNKENNSVSVSFDKHVIQVADVISTVMAVTEVKDIQVQDTELAEIVKQIYNNGV